MIFFSFDLITALALWFIVTAWGRFQGLFFFVSSKGQEHSWCVSKGIGMLVVNLGVSACQPLEVLSGPVIIRNMSYRV